MAFTYFFRDMHTLELTVRHVVSYVTGRSKVRVWDAGCATGPEPYSLAILFAEHMGQFAYRNLRIDASDIDESNIFGPIIEEGLYPESDLRRIPPALLEKYFEREGNDKYFRVVGTVRKRVTFRRHDLLSEIPIGDGFSLVVCKNVLLHYQAAQQVAIIRMFHRSLAPGGYLALEQTQRLPVPTTDLFEQVTHDAQVFRKVDVN